MTQPLNPHPDAQHVSDEMKRKRRTAVELVAEKNRRAHQEARKVRKASDERRRRERGPDDR